MVVGLGCGSEDVKPLGAALSPREVRRKCAEESFTLLARAERIQVLLLGCPTSTTETTDGEVFMGRQVLKRTNIDCPTIRIEILSALQSGFDEDDGYFYGLLVDRLYGLEAILPDGRIMQMELNFQSELVGVHVDGRNRCQFSTTSGPTALFERILEENEDGGIQVEIPND